jgi:hypothetical protein
MNIGNPQRARLLLKLFTKNLALVNQNIICKGCDRFMVCKFISTSFRRGIALLFLNPRHLGPEH